MTTPALKVCPFCGVKVAWIEKGVGDGRARRVWRGVQHPDEPDCILSGWTANVQDWNTREAPSAVPLQDGGVAYWDRPFGDAGDALDFALDHVPDTDERVTFLKAWREGRLDEWPEYMKWLAVQHEGAKAARAVPQEDGEPTQRGDETAEKMRAYFEAHKHDRWREGEADSLMLGLLNIVIAEYGIREASRDRAYRHACRLAEAMHEKFYADVPQFRLLPDILGVIDQIDNMVAGLAREAAAVPQEDQVERVARAICQAEAKRHYGIDRGADESWTAATDYARTEWLADARAALAALRSSGIDGGE